MSALFALLNIITLLYAVSAIPANVVFNLLLVRKLMRTCPRTAFLISLATSVALFTPLACGNGAFFRHIYIPWYLAWWLPPDPAPRPVGGDIGQLGTGRGRARAQPLKGDEALAGPFRQRGQFAKQVFAVRVAEIEHIASVRGGIARVVDHHAILAQDRHVAIGAVAQAVGDGDRARLGGGGVEFPGRRLGRQAGDGAVGGLVDVGERNAPFLHAHAARLHRIVDEDRGDAQHAADEGDPQLALEGQGRHLHSVSSAGAGTGATAGATAAKALPAAMVVRSRMRR